MRLKSIIGCAWLAVLAGCSSLVVPPQAWNFDPARPAPKTVLPPQEVSALTDRLAELQQERNALRARIAGTADAGERLALYTQLHRVGMELSPLERRLATVSAAR